MSTPTKPMAKATPFAITLDTASSLANKTGSWRTERPVYRDLLPPCNNACPAGENIQQWLYLAEEGGDAYEKAWRTMMIDNPLPACMGRICYHPCETACNRGMLDTAVGINSVERFLGDQAIEHGWNVEVNATKTGKRVLVVGSGPGGLSAAYHLAMLGHSVTIFDSEAAPGGMMRYGIPAYRLPRNILDAEIARIVALGVEIVCGHKVTDIDAEMKSGGFDAAFISVGATVGKHVDIPAGDAAKVLDAVSVLKSMEDNTKPLLGRRVAIYGGGNTAMDAARTARRLGATDAVIVYRRNRDKMPAHDFEVAEAIEEGVKVKWLSTIKEVDAGKVVIEKMELDETGFPQPTGEFEELEADSVVLALGQESDLSLVEKAKDIESEWKMLKVDGRMMTSRPGVFAGGDVANNDRTATIAIGQGKKAARNIDAYLRAGEYLPTGKHDLASFERLNTWYYSDAPATVRPQLDAARRVSSFDEVVGGLDENNALFEARRCLSCGNCFECDNCYGVCPDNVITKLGPGKRFEIDYDYCKGCGLCAAECPCGCIEMVPEEI